MFAGSVCRGMTADEIRPFDEHATLAVHVVPTNVGAINVVDALVRAHDGRGPAEPRFAALDAWARGHVRLVDSMSEANLVLYPSTHNADVAGAQRAADAAHAFGRTCLFFDAGDTWTPFPLTRGIFYRTSCDRRAMRASERAMPAFVGDAIDEARDLGVPTNAAPHAGLPAVGFVGYVGTPTSRAIALATGQFHKWRGLTLRDRVVKRLRASAGLRVDAIARATFGGGAHADAARRAERLEFLRNLFANAYTLCLRGKGNFSFRFYEVLCAARVPLFVDTRCVLPFEDELDWRSLLAWVDERELPQIGERLTAFHARFDEQSFAAHEARLREIWETHCSPLGFVKQLARRHATRDSSS